MIGLADAPMRAVSVRYQGMGLRNVHHPCCIKSGWPLQRLRPSRLGLFAWKGGHASYSRYMNVLFAQRLAIVSTAASKAESAYALQSLRSPVLELLLLRLLP